MNTTIPTHPELLLDLQYDAVLCRYDEIAMKGRNRSSFERRLGRNLQSALTGVEGVRVTIERGRLFLLPPKKEKFRAEDVPAMRTAFSRVFGLSSASPGILVDPSLEAIDRAVMDTFPAVYEAFATRAGGEGRIEYAMRARRSGRQFPMTSTELEIHFADKLLPAYPRLKMNLDNPELCIEVEVRRNKAFVSYDRLPGPGGLPNGSSDVVLALLSGGIDSPVACYQVMKRGCPMDFATFHSSPYTPPGTIEKVAQLVRILNRHQAHGRLYAINLVAAQKAIRDTCAERFRTILYRRMMVRLCTILARATGAKALVTGDAIGQVASQTLQNLCVISAATSMMILRPLIGADKKDTMTVARGIGTLRLSEQEMPDSCTTFAPRTPTTNAPLDRVEGEEAKLDMPALLTECLDASMIVDVETMEETLLRERVPGLDVAP